MSVAHNVEVKSRTEDVHISESITFAELLLSEGVLDGLTKAGFKRPSPIQLKAIPLGRCGLDLIVQAKSGTGKTCVFSVIALEGVDVASDSTQVLVLAPTREIAIQISSVIQTLGISLNGLATRTFIGGTPLVQDKIQGKNCHIAVGTPGRIKQLIELGALRTGSLRLFVLDEADRLLDGNFAEDINWIYSMLPDNKQILALSATYPEYLANELTKYMRNPTIMRLNVSDPALIGIKQYHHIVPSHHLPNKVFDYKTEAIIKILSCVSFQQCLIFSNLQSRAQSLRDELQSRGWPAVCIAGCLDQKERNFAMDQLKTYQCRILISTDLTARGIDADRVNLVINLDVPYDHETYLHRIGRAGRFGNFGAAISIVSKGGQDRELWMVEKKCKTHISKLPDPIPKDLVERKVAIKLSDIVSTEKIVTCEQENSDPIMFESNSRISQDHLNEVHSEPQMLQPEFHSQKYGREKTVQQHEHSLNSSYKLENQGGSSSEACENKNVNTGETCDSSGFVCRHTEVNEREIGREHEKLTNGSEDCIEINSKQKFTRFPSMNDHVDVSIQGISLQTCYQEDCATNSADSHISQNGNVSTVVSPVDTVTTDSKVCIDAQKPQAQMLREDSLSSHTVLQGGMSDSITVDNEITLSHPVHSAWQDVSKSTEIIVPEKYDDGNNEKGSNPSIEKKCSSSHKTKKFPTSNKKGKQYFRPLAVSHFLSKFHEDNNEANMAINSFPEKNGSKSRESTSARWVISNEDQFHPTQGKFPHGDPLFDLKQSPNYIGLCIDYTSSIWNTDNKTADAGWKTEKDVTLFANGSTRMFLSDDENDKKFSNKAEKTLPLVETTLCQEINVDNLVPSKTCSQPSKSPCVTIIPYSSEVKADKQNDRACIQGKGNTVNYTKRDDFSSRQDQSFNHSKAVTKDNISKGTESQISASVNALTFSRTHSAGQNVSAIYKHICDCYSKKNNQTDVSEKNMKDEIRVAVQSLSLDSLKSFGRFYGDEVALLYDLKDKLVKRVENVQKEGRKKPKPSMKAVGATQLEQTCSTILKGLNAELKQDDKVRHPCKNQEEFFSSVEQKIEDSDDRCCVEKKDKRSNLKQDLEESVPNHHVEMKQTNNVTTEDKSVDESKGSSSFPRLVYFPSDMDTINDQAVKAGSESEIRVKLSMVESVKKAEHQLELGEETAKTPAVSDVFQTEKHGDSHYKLSQCPSISNKRKSIKEQVGADRPDTSFVRNLEEHMLGAQGKMFISQNLSMEAAQTPSSSYKEAVGKCAGFLRDETSMSVSQMPSYSEYPIDSEDFTENITSGRKRDKKYSSTMPKPSFPRHKHQNEQMQKRLKKGKTVSEPSFDYVPFASAQLYGQSEQNFYHCHQPLTDKQKVRSFHENSIPVEAYPSVHPAYLWFSHTYPTNLPDLHFNGQWAPYWYSFCPNQPDHSYAQTPQQQFSWPFTAPSQHIFQPSVFQDISQMPSYASLYINHMTKVAQRLQEKYYS